MKHFWVGFLSGDDAHGNHEVGRSANSVDIYVDTYLAYNWNMSGKDYM